MGADVVDDVAARDERRNSRHHIEFMLAAPEAGFLRYAKVHPQSLRRAGLYLHPLGATTENAAAKEVFCRGKTTSCGRPAEHGSVEYRPLQCNVQAVDKNIGGVHS